MLLVSSGICQTIIKSTNTINHLIISNPVQMVNYLISYESVG
jgi:hypothetical protein